MENNKEFNLNTTYNWFSDTLTKSVKNAAKTFLESNFEISLASINNFEALKKDPLLKNELFYTCRIPIKNKQHMTLRATSDFIRIVFHDLFGSNQPVFDLEKMTELETRILNGFFEYISKEIEQYLIKEHEVDKINPLIKDSLNFVFLTKNKETQSGKLCISIPLNRLQPKQIELKNSFEFDDFIGNFAYVDLISGCAKISLDDLKNLGKDDILVLENSDIRKMTLRTSKITTEFKVNPEPSIMIDTEEEGEIEFDNEYKEESMPDNKSMWDDIQIEVSAEFKKVKMTLGELKQISKGLVIDLGSVMNNEITLLVENKEVAKGELVIINDKYGVKVTEVYTSKKTAPNSVETPQQRPQPTAAQPQRPQTPQQRPQASQAQQGAKTPPPRAIPPRSVNRPMPQEAQQAQGQEQKEDFDYSNFEE